MSKVLPFRARQAAPVEDAGRLVTPEEAARFLNVLDRHGAPNVRWVVRHVTPRVQLSARVIRYWEADLRRFAMQRRAS